MLPIWNTYSFFTTYANIDKWEKDTTEVHFIRHGETENNLKQIMNGGEVDTPLNKTGKSQAQKAGKQAQSQGMNFDIIFSSPLARAQETASIIAQEVGYTGDIVVVNDLIEQMSGKYAGKTIDEIGNDNDTSDIDKIRKAYKEDNGVEDIDQFESRVIPAFQKIIRENK